MGRPKVSVNQTNGNLGRTAPSQDGTSLLIASAVVDATITALDILYGPYLSLADVEAAGFDEAYDDTNSVMVWHHARDFYALENNTAGTTLYILPVAKTVLVSEMLDTADSYAGALLQTLKGKIKLVIATRIPDGAYVPTYTDGVENDLILALTKAKALRTYEQSQQRPIDIVIEGRNMNGALSSFKDMRDAAGPNAAGVMFVIDQDKDVADEDAAYGLYARAGYVGGYNAGLPVQRDIGRVKNGPVSVGTPYLSNGTKAIDDLTDTELDGLHDKGYVFLVQHINKPGYYYNRSNSCTALTDDYAYFTHSRVANKANRIAVDVYTTELVDDIILNSDGTLPAPTIKDFQGKLEQAILANMTGEISVVTVYCDPLQNVATTDSITAELNLTPVGYGANIIVPLAFKLTA